MPKKELQYLGIILISILFLILSFKFCFLFLTPLIISFLIAAILSPIVKWIEKHLKMKKGISLIILIAIILAIFIGCIIGVVNWLSSDISNIVSDLPQNLANFEKTISDKLDVINKLPFIKTKLEFNTLLNKIDFTSYISDLTTGIFSIGKQIPDLLVKFIFIILFSFFFILKMDNIKNFILNKIPETFKQNFGKKIKEIVGGYCIGQVKMLIIMFFILLISFIILDVPYAFLLALITSFLDCLPIFGTGTVLIPYVIIEIIYKDYKLAIGLLVIYIITQFVRRIIEPKILGKTIGLDTFTSILCLFLGYQFMGALGLIIGVPLGVLIKYCYQLGLFSKLFKNLNVIKNWFITTIRN